MFKKIVLWIVFVSLISCDDTGRLGYQIEDNKVIYRSWNEGHGFKVKDLIVDIKTFININGAWAKDQNKVFYNGIEIPILSSRTFKALDKKFGKDNSTVYCANTLIDDADALSFNIYNDELHNSYGKDKYAAFLCSGQNGSYIRISSNNIKRFRRAGHGFYIDNEFVYYGNHILEGLNPKTFRIIDKEYVTDGNKVFIGRNEIVGVDVNTFEVLDITFAKSKDKNYFYSFEMREKPIE